jgi:AraC-like DNA-binding protein
MGLERSLWINEIPVSVQESTVLDVVEAMQSDLEFPFTLDTFAEMANYSPFHFARMFRAVTGIPPGEFLSALRFQRAKELVLTTDVSITDICFEVGFSSLGTFSSRFKQLVGTSPAQLRCLPELIDAMPPDRGADIHVGLDGGGALVGGTVCAPEPVDGSVYIGLFPAAIAQSIPVRGIRIAGAGRFTLPSVPRGTFRLLAAVIPSNAGPIAQLLPDRTIQVAADPEPLTITTGQERIERTLTLRSWRKVEPPILVALPALSMNCATRAWR